MSELVENNEHKPFVPASANIPELTVVPLIVGVLLGIIFGGSSLYLVLKVGLTVSASIPIAVLSITIFRAISKVFGVRQATILENNIVQTTGSAGESIAFGIGVTMPALLIMGYNVEVSRVLLIAVFGGILGILMMIPLRWSMIVKDHAILKYPEGTACAGVLVVAEEGGTSARTVFLGFFVGLFYKFMNVGFRLWNDVPEKIIPGFKGAIFGTEVSPELLGVGYIIGIRTAAKMAAGGILSSFVLIPAIIFFGEGLSAPLYPATKLISEMSPVDIWKNYILYIGAGAVAAGGIISLIQSLPTIGHSLFAGLSSLKNKKSGAKTAVVPRTERDISMKVVLIGVVGLVVALALTPMLQINFLGAILMVLFGFLFVTVSARVTGEIGSSSNPISGMTVATLLLTCLVFLAMGWVGAEYRVAALSIAAVVCVASSNGGTTAQDLKTGYLIGATPKAQQIAILFGALTSALVIGYTLVKLNDASTIYHEVNYPSFSVDMAKLSKGEELRGPEQVRDQGIYPSIYLADPVGEIPAGKYLVDAQSNTLKYFVDPGINGVLSERDDGTLVRKYNAPKARLMSMIIDGILTQKLPWGLVLLGVFISLVMEMCGVSSLAFAVGVYLPLSSSMPIFFGGLIRWFVDSRKKKAADNDSDSSPGVLMSSGLIAGGAIGGTALAFLAFKEHWVSALDLSAHLPEFMSTQWFPYLPFAIMCFILIAAGRRTA